MPSNLSPAAPKSASLRGATGLQTQLFIGLALVFALAGGSGAAQAADETAPGVGTKLSNAGTPKQQVDLTKQYLDQMRADLKSVGKIGDEAEKEGNVDKIRCVKKALGNIKALVSAAERSQTTMKDAIAANELDKASAAFRQVEVAAGKVKGFARDANECTGAKGSQVGNTEVSLTGGSLTDAGETDVGDYADDIVEPPPPTPYR